MQTELQDLLNLTFQPWGYFHNSIGPSMQPTLGRNPAIQYSSYAYTDRQDISVGDVVAVIPPKFDKDHSTWCKRVAALGEDRLCVNPGRSIAKYILSVHKHFFSLFSNVSCLWLV